MDKSLILNEIKKKENISTNKEFAEFLGIKATTLSMWHKRNTFDIELIFKKCEYLNPEWLLTGKGAMLKTDTHNIDSLDTSEKEQYEEKIRLLENTLKDKEEIINLLREQVNSLKKGDFEMPPLSMVAEGAAKYPSTPIIEEKAPKKIGKHAKRN